jgi:hypothetical protein
MAVFEPYSIEESALIISGSFFRGYLRIFQLEGPISCCQSLQRVWRDFQKLIVDTTKTRHELVAPTSGRAIVSYIQR